MRQLIIYNYEDPFIPDSLISHWVRLGHIFPHLFNKFIFKGMFMDPLLIEVAFWINLEGKNIWRQ